ncbi:hypothetical protein PKHYL_00960 [Psychrobacter sp. KH172YL61]|nr:DUF3817 domain-containing protein [Psychrobacter sp. KH172YL61]BBI65905.1 hypothetical protein PKHYL_00960 [Psychrobacter sp. KH172YL61]
MPQSQPSSKPTLTNAQAFALKKLDRDGLFGRHVFLLLLGIAMPLKYMLNMPEMVGYVGPVHGVLFIAYIVVLFITAHKIKMFLPFGPFVFDHVLKKRLGE